MTELCREFHCVRVLLTILVILTKFGSSHCTYCSGMAWRMKTGGGCTNTRGYRYLNKMRSTIWSTWG